MLCNVNGAPFDRGELQMLALRFLAAIENNDVKTLSTHTLGNYALTVSLGGTEYKGTLNLLRSELTTGGFFDIESLQRFYVVDVVSIKGNTWVTCLGERGGIFGIGVLPLKITFSSDLLEGAMLRANGTIKGKRTK